MRCSECDELGDEAGVGLGAQCPLSGVARLMLVSGMGADADLGSPYIRARGRGEKVVQKTLPEATIVRPGAMFGPGDALFGTLADLVRLLPILPLVGGGRTRLQPVFVEERGGGYRQRTRRPGTVGRTYELAGREVYTLQELVRITLRFMGKQRLLIPSALCGGRDAGAAVRTSAKPTAHHRPS